MTGLFLLVVVAGSYLAAHVAFDWIARRFRIVSGAEYLVLGIVLGPHVSGMLDRQAVETLSPIISLALGWTGALLGSQLVLAGLVRTPGVHYRIALVESLITFVLVAAGQLLLLAWTLGLHAREALLPAFALAAMAMVVSEAGITVAARGRGSRDPVVRQLKVSAMTSALLAILVFDLIAAWGHAAPAGVGRPPTVTEWMVIDLAVGAVGGVLFHLFVGEERHPDRLFIALAGGVILVTGAAAYLQLSPIVSGLVFGMTLANTSLHRKDIQTALARVERPLAFVMLILAGAWWSPPEGAWLLPVAVFLGIRAVAKVGGARLAARANEQLDVLGADWGRGLLGQGGLALVLGLSYLQFPDYPLPHLVFTAVVVSVLLTDVFSARLAASIFTTPEPVPAPPREG